MKKRIIVFLIIIVCLIQCEKNFNTPHGFLENFKNEYSFNQDVIRLDNIGGELDYGKYGWFNCDFKLKENEEVIGQYTNPLLPKVTYGWINNEYRIIDIEELKEEEIDKAVFWGCWSLDSISIKGEKYYCISVIIEKLAKYENEFMSPSDIPIPSKVVIFNSFLEWKYAWVEDNKITDTEFSIFSWPNYNK